MIDVFSTKVQNGLTIFSLMSGLCINLQKSTIFGVGRDINTTSSLASKLRCQVRSLPMMYLGLPLGDRILNCATWNHVIEIFRSKLTLWKTRHMSLGGCLILIKSVLGDIPIYPLSIRLLHVRIRNSLHNIMTKFLWGGGLEDRRKMYLVDWDTITLSCEAWGLGISDLLDMNVGLLMKWISRYGNERDKLWMQVVCTKSGVDPNILTLGFDRRSKRSVLVNLIRSLLDRRYRNFGGDLGRGFSR